MSSTSLRTPRIGKLLTQPIRRRVRESLEIEQLEPRILLSADLSPLAVAMLADQNDLTLSYDDALGLLQIHDTFTGDLIAEQAAAETSSIEFTGTTGDDTLRLDLAGSYIFPVGSFFDGGGGHDRMIGPDFDTSWIVDGIGAGEVKGLDFASIEELIGGAGNEDTFSILHGGQISGGIFGGAGGFDSVFVDGGGSAVTLLASSPDSGAVTTGGLTTTYSGFEPMTVTAAPVITIDLPDVDKSDIAFVNTMNPMMGVDSFSLTSAAFETHILQIDNTVTDVTIQLGNGNDTIDISGVSGSLLDGKLTIEGEDGDDAFILGNDFGDITLDAGAMGNDTIQVDATGTTVVTDTTITTNGTDVVTLLGDFEEITGDGIELNLAELRYAVNEVFDELTAVFDEIQGAAQFVSVLPLISGSNLEEKVDVTITKLAAFQELIENVRGKINRAIADVEADGDASLGNLETKLEELDDNPLDTALDYIGPGVLPDLLDAAGDIIDVDGDIASLLTAFSGSTTEGFGFVFELLRPNVSSTAEIFDLDVTVADIEAIELSGEITSGVERLAAAINAKLGTTDLLGEVEAIVRDGRIGFRVLSQQATEFGVKADAFGVGNAAADILGYSAADFLSIDNVKEQLTDLGKGLFELSGIDFSVIDSDTYGFSFDLSLIRESSFGMEFGADAALQGLEFEASAKVTAAFEALLSGNFVLELGAAGFGDESFSATITELGAGLELSATGSVAAQFGFLAVTGTVNQFDLDVGLRASTPLSYSIIPSGTVDDPASFVSGLSFDVVGFSGGAFEAPGDEGAVVDIDFTADAGLVAGTLELDIAISDVLSSPDPTIAFGGGIDVAEFANFSNLSAADVIKTIADLALWFGDLAENDFISGIDIPLVEDGLDAIFAIEKLISDTFLYDFGGDGQRDGDDTLLLDFNRALANAGLDRYLSAEFTATGFQLRAINPDVTSFEILADGTSENTLDQLGLNAATGTTSVGGLIDFQASAFLAAMTAGSLSDLTAKFRVHLAGVADPVPRDFSILADTINDNVRIGDDVAKLVDAFNAPNFSNATELAALLDEFGILPSGVAGYATDTDHLTYTIDLGSTPLFDVELGTDFEIDLAPILNVSSDARLVLSSTGSLQFTLGFDLSSDGILAGPATLLTGATGLDALPGFSGTVKDTYAVTASDAPSSITGILTADASFTISVNGGPGIRVDIPAEETFGFDLDPAAMMPTPAEQLAALIQSKVDAAGVTGITVMVGSDAQGNQFLAFADDTSDMLDVTRITVTVDSGDPAISQLGLQPSQTAGDGSTAGTMLTASLPIVERAGVITTDAAFDVTVGGVTYRVTVPASATFSIDDGGTPMDVTDDRLFLNRNLIDLVADVEKALETATIVSGGTGTADLTAQFDVGFQGSRLVLTNTDSQAFSVADAGNAAQLGFGATQDSSLDDLIIRIDGADDIGVSLDGVTDIQGVLAVFNGIAGLELEIRPDDPATPTDEGGKALRFEYTGPGNFLAIENTNGSGIAGLLGLVGMDVNPFDPGALDDEMLDGSPLGGVAPEDRFFLSDANPGDGINELSSILGFDFEARLGRLVEDITVFNAGGDQITSESIDLRAFDGKFLVLRDINGFADGTYEILSVTDDGVATLNGVVGVQGQSGGVGVINVGVDATASLGFIDITLASDPASDLSAPLFGAALDLGLNTGPSSPAADQFLTLGELIELIDGDLEVMGTPLGVQGVLGAPQITFTSGDPMTAFGGVDLTLDIAAGGADFGALASTLLGEIDPDFSLKLLALGNPLLDLTLQQAGGVSLSGGNTVSVSGDFTDALAPGADVQFTLAGANAGEVLRANILSVTFDGSDTTIIFDTFTNESSGAAADLSGEAANLTGTGIILLPTIEAELPDLGAFGTPQFADFGIEEILLLLESLVDFLDQFEAFDFLNEDIPVIERSVADLIDISSDLNEFIAEFRSNPSSSLQFLESALNDAIGISPSSLTSLATSAGLTAGEITALQGGDGVLDPFDLGLIYEDGGTPLDPSDDTFVLTLNFVLGAFFNEQLPVGFDLADALAGSGFEDIVRLAGSANLQASGGIVVEFGFGVDLGAFVDAITGSNPVTDAFTVFDNTSLRADLSVGGSDLSFLGGLGPIAVSVKDNGVADPAEIEINVSVDVQPTFTGRATLTDILANLDTSFEITDGMGGTDFGTISGSLPIFAPTDSIKAGTIRIGEAVAAGAGNVLNITNPDVITELGDAPEAGSLAIDVSEIIEFVKTFDPTDLNLFDQILLAVDGFDGLLDTLQDSIFGNLAELEIPLVGSAFADAATFIQDFQDDFVGPLRTEVENTKNFVDDFADADLNIFSKLLFELLGPSGIDLLRPLSETGANDSPDDYIALDADKLQDFLNGDIPLSEALLAWTFTIGDIYDILDTNIGFDLGIPGLGLRTDGSINLTIDWGLTLGLGLSGSEGLFFDVSSDNDLFFNIDASLAPGTSITGTLGFLELRGENGSRDLDHDGTPETTGLRTQFAVDVFDGGGTGADRDRVSFAELGDLDFEFKAYAEAAAVLDINLGLSSELVGSSVASGFPSVSGGFNFLWQFGEPGAPVPGDFAAALADSLKVVAFTDLAIDAGEFLTDVLGPIVDQISEVTEPIQPIIDFLTAPIPVISQLGLNLTLLDIAGFFADIDTRFIETLAEVITLINDVAALGSEAELIIPLVGDGDSSTADFGDAFLLYVSDDLAAGLAGIVPGLTGAFGMNPFESDLTDAANRSSLISGQLGGGVFDTAGYLIGQIDGLTGGLASDVLQGVAGSTAPAGEDKVFAFPWIDDPLSIFNVLLGEPLVLITADLAPLNFEFEWSQFFSIFGPLGVSITLTIEAMIDFAFGFDTQGIQDFVETDFQNFALILNGLYVSDTENPDGTGADVPELRFFGGISAAAELNLGIARGGVGGGLFIEVLFDLFDPDDDGRVRISELLFNIENQLRAPGGEKALAPLAIFDVTGEIFARLFAFLKVDLGLFEIDKEFDIVPPITILEFAVDFFRPPILATEQSNGDLVVNIGPFAEQRLLGDTTDDGETIRIEKVGGDASTVAVAVYSTSSTEFGEDTFTDATNTYVMARGSRLIVNGGAGNDDIQFINFEGDEVEFVVTGDAGDDTIAFVNPATVDDGIAGGFDGFHTIDGGAGADNIIGSLGTDMIIGGVGADTVDGNGGDDLIFGDGYELTDAVARGLVAANDGDDMLTGGDGSDIIFGSGGGDDIFGGLGDDLVLAEGGDVTFNAAGAKKIRANVNQIWNGAVANADRSDVANADYVEGNDGADIIFAGAGDDEVLGGGDDDIIFAGEGNDTVSDSGGFNIIFGDTGQITGDYTADLNFAVPDIQIQTKLADIAEFIALGTDAGRDTITGGANEDLILAGEGNDIVDGGASVDYIFAGGGVDTVYGGLGGDVIFGEAGADILRGDGGEDRIDGGSGDDDVEGGDGNDLLIATKGQDSLKGQAGDDTIRIYYQGGLIISNINVDGGTSPGDFDRLQIFGTVKDDEILLRANISGTQGSITNILSPTRFERVSYNDSVESVVVNGGLGDDYFALDDTAAVITINGGLGDDRFQVGQLFRTDRLGPATATPDDVNPVNGVSDEDAFRTIAVTRGFLSYGTSNVVTINGGLGNDEFTVFHNAEVLQLNGDEGDDLFTVRAFALVGSQEPLRERTDLTGGAGADLVRYAVNAPVNIDGGDGFDTLVVIGTEFGDDFVVTDKGVFGAGLNVNYVNIETLRVDGAEGNDRIFVQSTSEDVLTELFGGLGEDTFFMSGETPPVVSNDLRGHSGIIAHGMESTQDGSVFDGQTVFGVSTNVADDEEAFAVIRSTGGSTSITEGDAVGDTYEIVLTRRPEKDVEVKVIAPTPSPDSRARGSFLFRVFSDDAGATATADGSAVTLVFTPDNWNQAQTVTVVADAGDGVLGGDSDADREDTSFNFLRDDIDPPVASTIFDFDDDAYEGTRNAISVHSFTSREVASGGPGDIVTADFGLDKPTLTIAAFTAPDGPFTAEELVGHRLKITSGPGELEERIILAAQLVNGGTQMELTLSDPYSADDTPDATLSSYEIIVDDSLRGLIPSDPADLVEMVAQEIFDDRTFVKIGSAATDELIGRTFEVISGAGAGQSALVLSSGVKGYDSNGDPILEAGWIELNARFGDDPAPGESVYRMSLYDGLAAQVESIVVYDNDTPTVVADETNGYVDGTGQVAGIDDITAVIEASDGDQRGEWDVINFSLNRMPLDMSADVTVTVGFDAGELDLSASGAVKTINGDEGTLVFTIAAADWADNHEILVKAFDDIEREGFHNSLITFDIASADGAEDAMNTETLVVDPTIQASTLKLSFVPTIITDVRFDPDGANIDVDSLPDVDFILEGNTMIFFDPTSSGGVYQPGISRLVELGGEIEVSYTYEIPGFDGAFASSILVRLADDDAPTLLVRETGGSTDVIETDGYTDASKSSPTLAFDSYELVLTGSPDAGETVRVYIDELITKTTKTGGIRFDEIQVTAGSFDPRFDTDTDGRKFVEFDSSNWDDPLTVLVGAVPDEFFDGGDTKVFAPGPAVLSGILGPVVVNGAGGNGSLSGLEEPLLLPGELNIKEATGDVVTIADGSAEITVARADINGVVMHELRLPDRVDPDDNPDPSIIATDDDLMNLIDKTLEITRAPAASSVVDQFRLIVGFTVDDMGTATLDDDLITFQLNEAYELAVNENGNVIESLDDLSTAEDPANPGFARDGRPLVNRYALTSESLNFFVVEEDQVDVMFINDTDSPADSHGVLTSNRVYGFNMGPDIVVGGRERQGGITYSNLEVLELNLGQGYNTVDVLGTMSRDDGFKTWTFINSGTEVDDLNRTGERVGDTINILTNAADITTASGTGGIIGGNPSSATDFRTELTVSGETFADGELEGQLLRLTNTDLTETTVFERIIVGNVGNTLILDEPLPVLAGGVIDIDSATEWEIINQADGGLAINAQGGDDVINAGLGALSGRSAGFASMASDQDIVVFGGGGHDDITGGTGEDILFGDVGRVDYRNEAGKIVTRLGTAPEVILGKIDPSTLPVGEGAITLQVIAFDPTLPNEQGDLPLPVPDLSSGALADPFETADPGLIGLFVDINNGTGFRAPPVAIVDNTAQTFTVSEAFAEAFDDTTRFRISTVPEDQTDGVNYEPFYVLAIASADAGNDVIRSGGGEDVVIGGEGSDNIEAGTEDDIVFGDLGVIENDFVASNPAALTGATLATTRAAIRSIELTADGTSFDDTIAGNEGDDVLLGGQGSDLITGGDNDDLIFGDAGFAEYSGGVITAVETYDEANSGDDDDLSGNAGNDLVLGGLGADELSGDLGDDVLVGDHARLDYTLLDATSSALTTIVTKTDGLGGADTITGDGGNDIVFGGTEGDDLSGDAGEDLILGDNGVLTLNDDGSFARIVTSDTDPGEAGFVTATGGADQISGGSADDTILGGVAGDTISAGSQDDLVLGDYGQVDWTSGVVRHVAVFVTGNEQQKLYGGSDIIRGDEGEDVLIGAAGGDLIDGDLGRDLIFGDNVILSRSDADLTDFTDPRFRTLAAGATSLYGTGASATFGNGATDHDVLADGTAQLEPGSTAPVWRNFTIDILDHNLASESAGAGDVGDDYIAGGGDEDMIFGQLGDDVIQGDGSIDSATAMLSQFVGASRAGGSNGAVGALTVNASFEAATDADDYIEGNGGDDVIFGNLGQDDIIGDSSDLFSLTVGGDDNASERKPTGSDIIFGGSGLRADRNEYTEDENGRAGADTIALEDRHSRDSDMILGDNGRILRMVEVTGGMGETEYLSFFYDTVDDNPTEHYAAGSGALDRSAAARTIVVRTADLLDYTLGGTDFDPAAAIDFGKADEVHGETGDDFIYGMVGDDILYGDADDDDIIAGQGDDWVSGGTGQDGILGGDGRIYTAKNSTVFGEALNGIGAVDAVNEVIRTPGDLQLSTINIDNALKKIVDLTPFNLNTAADPLPEDIITDTTVADDDIIFGGLGSDFLHGGFGSDAISGAEAVPSVSLLPYSWDNPGNPGNYLAWGLAADRAEEFSAYDENNPRSEIFVDPDTFEFSDAPDAIPFLLNFDAQDGGADFAPDGQQSDGDDRIFGDLGNDWLVGGTGRDHMYGGFGDDLLNADDDHTTNGGTNLDPDSFASYADVAFGGGGRDVLIANTGGDRLIDWTGEFNSYIVPFSNFGAKTVSRNLQPALFDYLYDLSKADGADPTRDVDGETARNGEPYGEIAAVKQQDEFWQDQTGAPDDPQPGNSQGRRDVVAAEDFNTALTSPEQSGFAADTGSWSVENGKLKVTDGFGSADAVSVYQLSGGYLPEYFEIDARVDADKAKTGTTSNGYLVFDYQSATDFKFAGINPGDGRIEIGHRDASGWHVDASTKTKLQHSKTYDLHLVVFGTDVTLSVAGHGDLTHTFAQRFEDGFPIALNQGLIGIGTNDSAVNVDDFIVKVLPAPNSAVRVEEAGPGGAELLTVDALLPVLDEAMRRIAAILNLGGSSLPAQPEVEFHIANLDGDLVAATYDDLIVFDIDAAGIGYFIDATPSDDSEFHADGSAVAGGEAEGKIDLLTVVMHELGHSLGLDPTLPFMGEMLDPSQRLGLLDASQLADAELTSTSSSDSVLVYDERVGGWITEDEAMLLDAASSDSTATTSSGNGRKVYW